MSGSFEINQVGQRLIATFRGGFIPEDPSQLKGKSFDLLKFVQGQWSTLEWLVELDLAATEIFVLAEVDNFRGVADVKGLRRLEVETGRLDGLDFDRLGELTSLSVPWNNKLKGKIGRLKKLQKLKIVSYKEQSLDEFSALANLRELMLTQGSVSTLAGLEGCRQLETLELSYLRKLEDIAAIGSLDQLKTLHVEKCPHVKSVDCIAPLSGLDSLLMDSDWGEVPFGAWLRDKPKLRKLLSSTAVRDVDWDSLLALPEIDDIRIAVPREQLPSEQAVAALVAMQGRQLVRFKISGTKSRPWVGVYLMPVTGELAPFLRSEWVEDSGNSVH